MARAERASQHCTVVSKEDLNFLIFHRATASAFSLFSEQISPCSLGARPPTECLSATDRRRTASDRPTDRHTRTHALLLPHSPSLSLPPKSPFSPPSSLPLFLPPPALARPAKRGSEGCNTPPPRSGQQKGGEKGPTCAGGASLLTCAGFRRRRMKGEGGEEAQQAPSD